MVEQCVAAHKCKVDWMRMLRWQAPFARATAKPCAVGIVPHLRLAEAGNWTRAKAVGKSTLLLRRSSGRVPGSATVSMSPV